MAEPTKPTKFAASMSAKPIGYVVMFRHRDSREWEPMALTGQLPGGEFSLLRRACFTLFPTEADAKTALRALSTTHAKAVAKGKATILAVFPAGIAAPFGPAGAADGGDER